MQVSTGIRRRLSTAVAVAIAIAGVGVSAAIGNSQAHGSPRAGGQAAQGTQVACPQPLTAEQLQAHFAEAQQQFATRLASALGKPEAQVEHALQQTDGSPAQPPKPVIYKADSVFDDPGNLAPAAAKLGVTSQELAAAMQSTAPKPATFCTSSVGSATGGQLVTTGGPLAVGVGIAAPFDAIAQKLGHGITADQVRDALMSIGPAKPPAPSAEMQAAEAAHTEALANAIGVTVDQLKSALQSIQAEGCQSLSTNGPIGAGVTTGGPAVSVNCVVFGMPSAALPAMK